jgi:hypothetical protein
MPSSNGQSLSARRGEAAAYLARYWPEQGRRHDAAVALAGGLLRGGLSVQDAAAFIRMVAEQANDEEVDNRAQAVTTTARRLEHNQSAYGFPRLTELLTRPGQDGVAVVQELRRLLGITRMISKTYDYIDEAGCLRYQTVRYDPKDFQQRQPSGPGQWVWNLRGVERVLYRLPQLVNADPKETVWIVEGEKDADALHNLGLVSTTNVGGAGQWWASYNAWLRGRKVVLLPDNDDKGRKHMHKVAAHLVGVAASVRRLELPNLPDRGDVSDWLASGGTVEQLLEMAQAQPALDRAAVAQAQPPLAAGTQADWPEPVPLATVPAVPVFPLDVFPPRVRRFLLDGARTMGCPVDYLAVPFLVMAAAALGASRALQVKAGHIQRAILYAAVVGKPGKTKTPAQDMVLEPVRDAEEVRHAAWEKAWAEYQAKMKVYEADEKKWLKDREGDRPTKPERPVQERLTVGDITVETFKVILKENPHGVALVRDELIGWVLGMNQYRGGGKGDDQQFYQTGWSGLMDVRDRLTSHETGSVHCRHIFLCVLGGLVPDNLPELRGDHPKHRAADDGWVDRVLFTYPPEPLAEAENWLEVDDDTKKAAAKVFADLRALEMEKVADLKTGLERRPRSRLVKFTTSGKQAWQRFTQEHADECNAEDFPACLAGPWSKLRGYAARLALVLHFVRLVCQEAQGEDVDGESMDRAAWLITYFKAHVQKVFAVMDADPRIAGARRILEWVIRENRSSFKRWQLHKDTKSKRLFPTPETLDPPLDLLVSFGYLRALNQDQQPGRPGRKPEQVYIVNPLWDQQQEPAIEADLELTGRPDSPDLPDGAEGPENEDDGEWDVQ